ncbi:hypothetical protein NEIPOLOT_00919 [Neisseria polysaccharea ATCC 43768]|nr:hypothetical protein NEIPOLOT_00919 [Neisseria polysaccharea ATCC 43768]
MIDYFLIMLLFSIKYMALRCFSTKDTRTGKHRLCLSFLMPIF